MVNRYFKDTNMRDSRNTGYTLMYCAVRERALVHAYAGGVAWPVGSRRFSFAKLSIGRDCMAEKPAVARSAARGVVKDDGLLQAAPSQS